MNVRIVSREGRTADESRWLDVRSGLVERRFELGRAAADAYPDLARVGATPLLTSERWSPTEPLPLEDLRLELTTAPQRPEVDGTEGDQLTRPLRQNGAPYATYAHALRELDGRRFENRGTYRLMDADLRAARMRFGLGRYADGLDVGEAAGHEFAATNLSAATTLGAAATQPIRAAVGDPRDLGRRPANLAISMLTMRREPSTRAATCLLHWRDPRKVGHAGGLYQVLPVGMFQASGEEPWNVDNDFSLWRSMTREFAEELLGRDEHYDNVEAPIDYADWPFAARLDAARGRGSLRVYCLGLGWIR